MVAVPPPSPGLEHRLSPRLAVVSLAVIALWPAGQATAASASVGDVGDMVPGDGLRLAPGDPARPPGAGARSVALPATTPSPVPFGAVPLAAVAVLAGAAQTTAARRRRTRRHVRGGRVRVSSGPPDPWQDIPVEPPPEDVLFVFVVGHGNERSVFDDMKARLGLQSSQFVDFDYRWIIEDADHPTATQHATNDQLADALQALMAGLEHSGRPLYLVGFSKGGAGLAKLIARWDRSPDAAPDAVIGAALLDPPISDGALGGLQSLGLLVAPVPDDGFYDPEHCDDGGCVDERRHLGHASGVEVIVVRNPDSSLTNFGDDPEGLRIYDLEWDGGTPDTDSLPFDPLGFVRRSGAAHNAVLSSAAVAACISQETHRIDSCEWKGLLPPLPRWATQPRWWGWGSNTGSNMVE
jgi:hypothetical protein